MCFIQETMFIICNACTFLFTVIEVSCGEYGDYVRKLVAAIQNGKCDIQAGKPFPQTEQLNNADFDKKINNTQSLPGDTNHGNNLLSYTQNDISKETPATGKY